MGAAPGRLHRSERTVGTERVHRGAEAGSVVSYLSVPLALPAWCALPYLVPTVWYLPTQPSRVNVGRLSCIPSPSPHRLPLPLHPRQGHHPHPTPTSATYPALAHFALGPPPPSPP